MQAQDEDDKKDKEYLEDPYTDNEPERLAEVGIIGLGPFRWGDGHGTSDIDESLGGAWIRWVETEHFRIGSSLGEYVIDKNSKREKAKLKEELKSLGKILDKVRSKTRRLDPWLRLHLFVQRAESLYVEFEQLLGVTEEDFPTGPGQLKDGIYMGEGPYLGMQKKFNLLFTQKESALGRYRSGFLGSSGSQPIRHMFPVEGVLMFGVAAETEGMAADTSLHCSMVYCLTMNLMNGYRYYRHQLPDWMVTGFAHMKAREVDETRNYFTQDRLFDEDDKNIWDWEPKVRARVKHEYFPKFEEVMLFPAPQDMKYTEHMMSWSRVSFLLDKDPKGFRIWMDIMKAPFDFTTPITDEKMAERQIEALEKGWGLTPEVFDQKWAEWVLKNYRKD